MSLKKKTLLVRIELWVQVKYNECLQFEKQIKIIHKYEIITFVVNFIFDLLNVKKGI